MKRFFTTGFCLAVLINVYGQSDSTSTNVAADTTANDMFSMSIEDLMDIKVTTASKTAESIQSAPAVISVVSAKEIEGFGALSLSEVLDRLTSTYMISSSFAPDGMLAIRGKQTEHYNTNVLILLDGRPLRESFQGGYNGIIYSMFPVSQLERIEIIRGPGSVLYGSNAYVGVINLITKTGAANSVQGTIRYGSFNTKQAVVSVNKKIKDLEIALGVNALQSDGWDFSARGEREVIRNKKNTADSVFKDAQTIQRDNKGLGANLKVGYKGLTLNTFAATNDWATMGRVTDWSTPNDFRIRNNRLFADLGYQQDVSQKWTIASNMTYNHFDFESYSSGQNDKLTHRESDDILFEIANYIKPAKNFNIVIGGLSNMQSGKGIQPDLTASGKAFSIAKEANPNPWITVPYYDVIWNSAYFQADYTPIKMLKLVAGGQANKITGFKTDFVPRLGAILTFTDNLGLKLLYGQAFRAASAFERSSFSPPSVYGNPLLTPEKITTYEAQVFFTKSKLDISATYFFNHDGNKITRENVKDTLLISGSKVAFSQKYVNSGYVETNGIEVEAKFKIGSLFNLYGSSTYQTSLDNLDRKDYDGMPNLMAKIGVLFNFREKLNIGLFNSYFGTGGDINKYDANGNVLTKQANPNVTAYNYTSLNISTNLKNLLAKDKFPDLILQCYITNLLDEKVYYQEVVRRNINSLPGRAGRAINLSATVRF